jgi:hypothetical protein
MEILVASDHAPEATALLGDLQADADTDVETADAAGADDESPGASLWTHARSLAKLAAALLVAWMIVETLLGLGSMASSFSSF